jgi:hypothetical protein
MPQRMFGPKASLRKQRPTHHSVRRAVLERDYSASRAPLYSVSRRAFVCPAPVPRQYGSSITNIKAERPKEPRGALYKKPAQLEIGLSALPKRRCVA